MQGMMGIKETPVWVISLVLCCVCFLNLPIDQHVLITAVDTSIINTPALNSGETVFSVECFDSRVLAISIRR